VDVQPDYDVTRRLAFITRCVRPRGRVLELGAGTGEFCATLTDAGFTTVPVDPLGEAAWPSEQFDAVLAYLVLEHVYDPRDFIAEAVKRLGPDGVLIAEVPDFLRDPVASLVSEHLWHYAPVHLSTLFADFDLGTVEVNRTDASRAFAFMIAARRSNLPARPVFDADLIASMRAAYRRAATLAAVEDARTRALCHFVADRKPPRIFVWGANEYATRIGKRLAEIGFSDPRIIDSAGSKIGSMHQGFRHPIESPVFLGNEPENSAVLLCSPAWNEQIRVQVETSRLRKPWIIDAINWEPSVDTKVNLYAVPSLQ
jgi:SAM-dependent methyltransferase